MTKNYLQRGIAFLGMIAIGAMFTANATVVKPIIVSDSLPVTADVTVRSNNTSNQYGSNTVLESHYAGWDATSFMPIFKYDISDLSSHVEHAYMNISLYTLQRDFGWRVYKYSNDWDEMTVKFASIPDTLPFYDQATIDEDSVFALEAALGEDRYLGDFLIDYDWAMDSTYHPFEITEYVNEAIDAGLTEISIAFVGAQEKSGKVMRIQSKESELGSFIEVVQFESEKYFNNFSDETNEEWTVKTAEGPTYDAVQDGKLTGTIEAFDNTYLYGYYSYAPVDGQSWYFSEAYPIYAVNFKTFKDGQAVSYTIPTLKNFKLNNISDKSAASTYGESDSVLYWDIPNRFTGTKAIDYGFQDSWLVKLACGYEGTEGADNQDSYEIDWIGTFASVEALEAFIATANDATVSDIAVDGTTILDFAADTYVYSVSTDEVPAITATLASTSEYASMEITNASDISEATTIAVTAADGSTKLTYTINFTNVPTSIEEIASEVVVFTGIDMITISNLVGNENVSVYDMTGRIVTTATAVSSQLDINIASGVYIVKVMGNETATQKVSVQ